MSLNPPRPPASKKVQFATAIRSGLRGQELAIGIVIGFLLGLLARVVGG